MITSVSIDTDGNVTVTCDTDGDQGDGYSTDVMKDCADTASREALAVWFTMDKQRRLARYAADTADVETAD
jgi:hypothetical protein